MLTTEAHLDNLIRHIDLVRGACILLGRRLIADGRVEFGRNLIARGFRHDVSKFHGIEWEYLHAGKDVPPDKLELAIQQHVLSNDHHPEYWGGFQNMPEIAIAETVCDWYGRSQEFGTGLRDWINENAIGKYSIDVEGVEFEQMNAFIDILLENHFVPKATAIIKKKKKKK